MAEHARFTADTGVPVYFCDPRSPWQRASNENANGLVRQYLPRTVDLRQFSQADLDRIAAELNGRPRQILGFKTPSQALHDAAALTCGTYLVNDHELHPSADVTAADWLRPRLRRFASAVSAVVPDGFPAYVRILHPARGPKGRPVRWAEVAAWSGRSMHRLAQFHAISRPTSAARTDPAPWDGEDPPEGNLPAELLRILCAALAQHTSTPASCWLCLWDGYGWLYGSPSVAIMGPHGSIPVPPAFSAEVLDGPRVRLPGRDYLLFAGPLAAAPQLGWTDPYGFFFPQSPNLFWPTDHAWCVASEIDLFCTLVGGSDDLAEALLADPRLDAWPVQPDDPIAFDSDQINT